jgi:opacity protein-like surface antigen
MKKFLVVSLLAAGLSIPAYSEQVVTPTMSGDNPSLDYAGVSTFRLSNTHSTNQQFVSSHPVIVYGLSISSVAATTYVKLYSTNTLTLLSATPKRIQFNDDNGADEGAGTAEYKWAAPTKFPLGLVVQASAAIEAGTQSEAVIYYRELK